MFEIDTNYFGVENIVLVIVMITLILILRYIKNIDTQFYKNVLNSVNSIKVFLIVILSIVIIINIISIGQRVYLIKCYQNQNYHEVRGKVDDLNYILANNSNILIGISFKVNDVKFEINKGVLDYGYSVNEDIAISEGEYVEIYYIDANTILRINK